MASAQRIIREPVAALGYLLLFGLGTIVRMMRITLILSAPFAFTAINLPEFNWQRRVASGLVNRTPVMHAGLFRRCDD